ncbi:DUF6384 family protein [Reyranella sp. CPCC 100927]|uniref:DUF6384 family protein n=1 Tax=Reyranella sp. CPCC 100927 TaxID=2599616 RepID=UPI0011B508F9|nr:DUF6384 family protein [Reyranella sp. CPCC 100927]TWT13756.1 hypothetical protein FQU96_07525 [Reyranella sp. CPCC 100927]
MPADSPAGAAAAPAVPRAKLDDLMLAMDVVDTLRHRERLVERELAEEVREQQLIERLRDLYKSQGIEVSDATLAEGVKALKESRFVYTPPKPGLGRTLATLWVNRATHGKWIGGVLVALVAAAGVYQFAVVGPRERDARAAQVELTETLPRQLAAAHQAITTEAQVPVARQRADALLAQGRAALERGNAADARQAVTELDRLAATLRQEYTLRIAGRPEDQTGFYREHPSFQGRAYFVVVDALDANGNAVRLPVRNDETSQTETVSRFAVRVPLETFNAVRDDKAKNGIVQNARLGEKRRGYVEPDFRMPVLESRITRW